MKLHDEIELASLDELIAHMEVKFAATATEPQWQKLFESNPFMRLSLLLYATFEV